MKRTIRHSIIFHGYRKSFFSIIFFCFFALCLSQTAFGQEGKREISSFLETNYGIIFKPSFFQKSRWNCPEKRMVKPSGNVRRNWICERPDPKLKRVILWRVDSEAESTVEVETFDAMAGKSKERGEPQCKETSHTIADGKIEGTIRDCMLPLPNGEFYVSFFHFSYRNLGFTFRVANASPTGSTPKVAEDLREWLSELKFSE